MSARIALVALLASEALMSCSRARKAERPTPPPTTATETEKSGVPARDGHPAEPASPEALLGNGAVGRIQRALVERKLLGEHEPGSLDAPTSAAIRRFQRGESLAETGFPDRETLQRLGIDPESAYRTPEKKQK